MRLKWEALGVSLILFAGCAGGSGTTGLMVGHGGNARETQSFNLRILDDGSGAACRPGEAWFEAQSATDGTVAVEVHISWSAGLNALYCAVDYDAGSYTPVSAAASGLLGERGELLELAVLSEPGTAYLGQVQTGAGGVAAPFAGDGVAARFVFKAGRGGLLAERRVSAVPIGNLPQFQLTYDFEKASPYGDYLKWLYVNPGDYDQNGEVGITDLSAMAPLFGLTASGTQFPFESRESVADGDQNGEINSADMTIIAQNLGNRVQGFSVFASVDPADAPPNGASPNGAGAQFLVMIGIQDFVAETLATRHEYRLAEPGLHGQYYWVRMVGADSTLGSTTNVYKLASFVPPSSDQPGIELKLVGAASLEWFYANPGDYDQSGVVNSQDLNLVGLFFGQTGPWPSSDVRRLVDGNCNGEIELNDVVLIGQHMFTAVEGYNVYASTDPSDYPSTAGELSALTPFATEVFPDTQTMEPPGWNTQRVSFQVDIPAALQGQYYWVRPYYGEAEGVASPLVGTSV